LARVIIEEGGGGKRMSERWRDYKVPAVAKAFALLEEVAREPGKLGISELARRLNLPKSTVHSLVKELTRLEVLVSLEMEKGFRLGPRLRQLGRKATLDLSLEVLAQPYLERLSRDLQETVFLGTCNGKDIVITAKADSPAPWKITAPVGTKLPLLAGATAKVFLSTWPDDRVTELLAEKLLPRFTPRSITDPEEFLRQVREAREKGYATDFEEYLPGVNAACVLLPLDQPQPVAIWVVGLTQSLTPEKIEEAVEAVRSVAGELKNLNFA
jgi:DNA-binding IclR family transcriptional regulator